MGEVGEADSTKSLTPNYEDPVEFSTGVTSLVVEASCFLLIYGE
jgi:hypothetical protein